MSSSEFFVPIFGFSNTYVHIYLWGSILLGEICGGDVYDYSTCYPITPHTGAPTYRRPNPNKGACA